MDVKGAPVWLQTDADLAVLEAPPSLSTGGVTLEVVAADVKLQTDSNGLSRGLDTGLNILNISATEVTARFRSHFFFPHVGFNWLSDEFVLRKIGRFGS